MLLARVLIVPAMAGALASPAHGDASLPVEANGEDVGELAVAGPPAPPPGLDQAGRDLWLATEFGKVQASFPELAASKVAWLVGDLDGKDAVVRSGDDPLSIASAAKLITAGAALAHLGPTYRFRTFVLADARKPALPRKPDAIDGDLVLRGGADPTLDSSGLALLADEVVAGGLKTVSGSLVVDTTFFDDNDLPPVFGQKLEDAYFRAPVSALSLDANAAVVRVRPALAAGPARVSADAASDYLVIVNEVSTVESGRTSVRAAAKTLPGNKTEIHLRGTIRLDDRELVVKKRVEHPARLAGERFKALLVARGVRFGKKNLGFRAASPTARELARRESEALAVIVRALGKRSDNFVAETLLKTLGAEIGGPPGTWDKGLTVARAWLAEAGASGARFDNGSGLYDATRFSARQVAAVLRFVWRDFRIAPDYVGALAIAGGDGTLGLRMAGTPAAGWLRGKTGTLEGVVALAGYLGSPSQDGRPLVFVVLVNNVPVGKARSARGLADWLAALAAAYAR